MHAYAYGTVLTWKIADISSIFHVRAWNMLADQISYKLTQDFETYPQQNSFSNISRFTLTYMNIYLLANYLPIILTYNLETLPYFKFSTFFIYA
jgi:hypothetical protein